MDVFALRQELIADYSQYASSFIRINDERIAALVDSSMREGAFWPDPLIQLNPSFETGGRVSKAVRDGLLDERCERIFRRDKATGNHALRLHHHQRAAIEIAADEQNYVLTTGTGSGKSLAYIVPIVDHVLRRGSGRGIQAIIVYPMNALVNSQEEELKKFLHEGFAPHEFEVSFDRYTGQEGDETRQRIVANPPDILLTNYVMLELMMTRPYERKLIERAKGLRFLILDELHTYRGRQGRGCGLADAPGAQPPGRQPEQTSCSSSAHRRHWRVKARWRGSRKTWRRWRARFSVRPSSRSTSSARR